MMTLLGITLTILSLSIFPPIRYFFLDLFAGVVAIVAGAFEGLGIPLPAILNAFVLWARRVTRGARAFIAFLGFSVVILWLLGLLGAVTGNVTLLTIAFFGSGALMSFLFFTTRIVEESIEGLVGLFRNEADVDGDGHPDHPYHIPEHVSRIIGTFATALFVLTIFALVMKDLFPGFNIGGKEIFVIVNALIVAVYAGFIRGSGMRYRKIFAAVGITGACCFLLITWFPNWKNNRMVKPVIALAKTSSDRVAIVFWETETAIVAAVAPNTMDAEYQSREAIFDFREAEYEGALKIYTEAVINGKDPNSLVPGRNLSYLQNRDEAGKNLEAAREDFLKIQRERNTKNADFQQQNISVIGILFWLLILIVVAVLLAKLPRKVSSPWKLFTTLFLSAVLILVLLGIGVSVGVVPEFFLGLYLVLVFAGFAIYLLGVQPWKTGISAGAADHVDPTPASAHSHGHSSGSRDLSWVLPTVVVIILGVIVVVLFFGSVPATHRTANPSPKVTLTCTTGVIATQNCDDKSQPRFWTGAENEVGGTVAHFDKAAQDGVQVRDSKSEGDEIFSLTDLRGQVTTVSPALFFYLKKYWDSRGSTNFIEIYVSNEAAVDKVKD